MTAQFTSSPYLIAALILLGSGLLIAFAGLVALFRAQISSFTARILLGLLLLAFGMLSGTVAMGIQGYQALTKEEIAAYISVSPIAPQRMAAIVRYPDGRVANFILAGDEIYIDAHIIKWQPIANFFGLHTTYELDRIGGRYRDLTQERNAERTIHSLRVEKPVDLFGLRQRHTFLALLLDAKYGSATFVPVIQAAELELTVSTTGLLIRELNASTKKP